ncbi:TMhelix containing protein [Vibrio phage 416E50-1]|nr:TMhelix containing protein [Vibrio phage 416E50-1]
MSISIITAGIGLVGSWLQGKQKVQEAKAERETKALTNEANWDSIQAEAGKNSWKDEWLTILVSIPLVMAFIPDMDVYVEAGFEVLDGMPEWYQYTVGLVFAASFGVKGALKVIGKK